MYRHACAHVWQWTCFRTHSCHCVFCGFFCFPFHHCLQFHLRTRVQGKATCLHFLVLGGLLAWFPSQEGLKAKSRSLPALYLRPWLINSSKKPQHTNNMKWSFSCGQCWLLEPKSFSFWLGTDNQKAQGGIDSLYTAFSKKCSVPRVYIHSTVG